MLYNQIRKNEMEGIMVEVKPGMTVWSDVLGANVEVLRVHKSTATVRVWGRGLAEGKLMIFRGQRLDSLRPKRDELFRIAALAMEEMRAK
jgi:hypothetical protein